jgi:hypothetical protein
MKNPVFLALAALVVVSASSLQVAAQPAPAAAAEPAAQVEVGSVKFGAQRFNGDSWLEGAVDLNIRPGGRAVSGQFVDRVRVTLTVSFEVPDEKGGNKNVFYRSSAEAITLEGGRSTFRFYIPPEVVRRDKLRNDVKFFVVEIEAAGQQQPLARGNASTSFTSAESIRNFLSRANSEGAVNDGVMLPQHLTPFAFETRLPAPSMVRREAQR